MKKNRVVALLLCAALLLSGFTNTMVKAAGATGKQTTTAQKSKWPSGPSKSSLSSDSAIVMELSTGTILYRKNIHKQHYPASITKIMTAMLTAENCSLDETVTFSKTAVYGIGQLYDLYRCRRKVDRGAVSLCDHVRVSKRGLSGGS